MDIVSRSQWGATKEATRPKMTLPATALWLHHSVTVVTDDPYADMRALQRVGIQRFGYFSYSYAIHPGSGVILEGQGVRVGAHTRGQNSTTFGVALIGNYMTRVVTDAQVDAVRRLIWHLRQANHLRPGTYPSGGHREVPGAKTACPGDWAMKRIDDMRLRWTEPLPEPVVEVAPMYDPPLGPFAAAWLDDAGRVISAITPAGNVYWGKWWGNVAGKPYWGDRVAADIGARPDGQEGYRVLATSGEHYDLPDGYDQL